VTDVLKLTTYFGERLRHGREFVSDELLETYARESVAISIVLRGAAGFGPRHELRSDQTLSASEALPVAIAAVDTAEKIEALAQRAVDVTSRGLITLERARVLDPSTPAPADPTKLTIYLARQQRIAGRPAYRFVCDRLRQHGFDSAAVFLGVDGTVRGERRRAEFFGANASVPVMVIAVGAGERIADVVPQLTESLPDPLMTVERVQLCKRDGVLVAPPAALPATDANGHPLWQKLMVHTSEADLRDGEPIHRALVRRLREDPSNSGATVLRGIWGFRGDRLPHGDRLIQLGRDVPVTTVVVDSPDRIAAAFAIVDDLTCEDGVVTAERVPALLSIDHGDRRGSMSLARFE
jgi:PII-like signaling protein